jgi:hypothetical protein
MILDELLRRYLVYIGLREFKTLSVQEVLQFALLAIYRVVDKHGLEGISVEDFWRWVSPGESYSCALLLPDTIEGRAYHAEQFARRQAGAGGEETVILRGIDDVKRFMRRVFINLINEEMRTDGKQRKIKTEVQEENSSSVRRGQSGGEGHQPLDEMLRHMRDQRDGAELEAVRLVMRRVEEKMDVSTRRIVHLLNDGNTPQEVAGILDLTVQDIYNTYRAYRTNCKKMWSRLFGPK